jgi:hypothetical protein
MSVLELTSIEKDAVEVEKMCFLVTKLVELGDLISSNKINLENLAQEMRNESARNSFMTMEEVGLALRCNADKAKEFLLSNNVPLVKAGKGYVVNKVQFERYFQGGDY